MQRGLVPAPGLRIGAADGEVDGPADLLVEEDRPDRAVDAEVRADAELAEAAGAVVGRERALEVVVAVLGPGRDDRAVAERHLDALDVDAGGGGRDVEEDRAVRARLDRPGEDLAARHVAPAVAVDPGAALDAERQVGARGLDPDLRRLL